MDEKLDLMTQVIIVTMKTENVFLYTKAAASEFHSALTYASPNVNELFAMAGIGPPEQVEEIKKMRTHQIILMSVIQNWVPKLS